VLVRALPNGSWASAETYMVVGQELSLEVSGRRRPTFVAT
jgi:hypothetical protein